MFDAALDACSWNRFRRYSAPHVISRLPRMNRRRGKEARPNERHAEQRVTSKTGLKPDDLQRDRRRKKGFRPATVLERTIHPPKHCGTKISYADARREGGLQEFRERRYRRRLRTL